MIRLRPDFLIILLTAFGAISIDHASFAESRVDRLAALEKEFNEHKSAQRFGKAEVVGRRMLELAEREFANRPELSKVLHGLVVLYAGQGKYAEAEPFCLRALAIQEKLVGSEHSVTATNHNNLGFLYAHQGNYAEAETRYRRALAIREKLLGPEHDDTVTSLNSLAHAYANQGKYAEAEPLHQRLLAICEKLVGSEHPDTATILYNLAFSYFAQGKYVDAEPLYRRALAIREKLLGREHADTVVSVYGLAELRYAQSKYADAESLYRRALAICESVHGAEHADTAQILQKLAQVSSDQRKFAEAERFYERSLTILERNANPESLGVVNSLIGLARQYVEQAKFSESLAVLSRASTALENWQGPESAELSQALHDLAHVYLQLGQYTSADALFKRSLGVRVKQSEKSHDAIVNGLLCLGRHYLAQGIYYDADVILTRALEYGQKHLASEDSFTASVLHELAHVRHNQERNNEAELLHRQAIAIQSDPQSNWTGCLAAVLLDLGRVDEAEHFYKQTLGRAESEDGEDSLDAALEHTRIAKFYIERKRFQNAEEHLKQALAIEESKRGDHPDVADTLIQLGRTLKETGKLDQAIRLVDRAIDMHDRIGSKLDHRSAAYHLRAKILWARGDREEALTDLREAMDLAEQLRLTFSGTDHQRAEAFVGQRSPFDLMVAWQHELGDNNGVLAAIERARARSLLDQMSVSGRDLHAGRSTTERTQLVQSEFELRVGVSTLEKQLAKLAQSRLSASSEAVTNRRKRLEADLAKARQELYDHYSYSRMSSPVYRDLLSVSSRPPRLRHLQSKLLDTGDLLLIYTVGNETSYVLEVTPDASQLVPLEIDETAAAALDIAEGALSGDRLQEIMSAENDGGLLSQLRTPAPPKGIQSRLAGLARVLFPGDLLERVADGTVARLLIVPDAALSLLPFETLVLPASDSRGSYLVEVGPPIVYGPSASVLLNLQQREPATATNLTPVLTIGNPAYVGLEISIEDNLHSQLTTRAHYRSSGGRLASLPFSGWEANWIEQVFQKRGVKSRRLVDDSATEANVRREVSGREIVHFACHGLADEQFGNFFGWLALTPGAADQDPADDGFLTLPEIYELDLDSCELSILSACETNVGRQQKGEGIWALSRGFLVAGSKRVVASSWLVDDEAAASIMSVFCSYLARAKEKGIEPDYADALRKAKNWAREQDKWSSPYYWGTFVLVGPN